MTADNRLFVKHVAHCTDHHYRVEGYIRFFDDCKEREKRGEKQAICDECNLWVWPR